MGLQGGVQADIKFAPQKSQIFIAICSLASFVSIMISFAFLWTGREHWDIPLCSGGALIGVAFVCWLISHRNVDLSGGNATEIKITPDQMSVIMDPRASFDKTLLQGFSDYINVIVNRKPLPMSSGIVSADGSIVPGSAKESEEEIIRLNLLAEQQLKQAVKFLRGEAPSVKEVVPVSIEPPDFTGDVLPSD